MKTENKFKVWTHFAGKNKDLLEFMRYWDDLLGSKITAYFPNKPKGEEFWYCEAFVTQEQIDEFSMDQDWFTI